MPIVEHMFVKNSDVLTQSWILISENKIIVQNQYDDYVHTREMKVGEESNKAMDSDNNMLSITQTPCDHR